MYSVKKLTREKELSLAAAAADGNSQATWELALSAMPVLEFITAKYASRGSQLYQELIQVGVLALYQAARYFNRTPSFRFATYARCFYVRRAVTLHIRKWNSAIDIPSSVREWFRVYEREREQIGSSSAPTDQIIAERIGCSVTRLHVVLNALQGVVPLFEKRRGDDGCVADTIASMGVPADEQLELQRSLIALTILLESGVLSEKQARVLTLYYGLSGEDRMSFARIGREMDLSGERIRQIHNKALAALRENL